MYFIAYTKDPFGFGVPRVAFDSRGYRILLPVHFIVRSDAAHVWQYTQGMAYEVWHVSDPRVCS